MSKTARNWIHIRPGSPAFIVSNNACDYFELGERAGEDVWLEGRLEAGEFVFDGRIFPPDGGAPVTLTNFPQADPPAGCIRQPLAAGDGYELVRDGVVLFGFEILPGRLCRVTVDIADADGALIACARDARFELQRGPALIGRSEPAREAA